MAANNSVAHHPTSQPESKIKASHALSIGTGGSKTIYEEKDSAMIDIFATLG